MFTLEDRLGEVLKDEPKALENLRYTECQGVNVSLDLWSDGMYVVFLESSDSADEDYIEFYNYEDALEEFERTVRTLDEARELAKRLTEDEIYPEDYEVERY